MLAEILLTDIEEKFEPQHQIRWKCFMILFGELKREENCLKTFEMCC